MTIEVTEKRGSYEGAAFDWDRITHSLQIESDVLPKGDRRFFNSLIRLIIGKEIKLSNLDPNQMYTYILRGDAIFVSNQYSVIPREFVRREVARLIYRLGIKISENGLGWKFGPMGFQTQHVKQELIQPSSGGIKPV